MDYRLEKIYMHWAKAKASEIGPSDEEIFQTLKCKLNEVKTLNITEIAKHAI